MDLIVLAIRTIELRPYVFVFLAMACFSASRLLGWPRTGALFGVTWATAFVAEYSSTRIGIPFGDYFYTGSTTKMELYVSNVPFMDSLSFTFLLYASYAMALVFVLPMESSMAAVGGGTSLAKSSRPLGRVWRWVPALRLHWAVIVLASLFFMLIDVVIDPVALRGDRWFLGQIYGYPDGGVYFGVPISNFLGWAVVGVVSLLGFRLIDTVAFKKCPLPKSHVRGELLSGIGLYYLVLVFNLAVTFWIGEASIGAVGCFIYLPVTVLVLLRIAGKLPALPDAADKAS